MQQQKIMYNIFMRKFLCGKNTDILLPTHSITQEMFKVISSNRIRNCNTFGILEPYHKVICNSYIRIPNFSDLVRECGKMRVLSKLLIQLKKDKHRVLIYSQMTAVLDILEEFLSSRGFKYVRLDGNSSQDCRREVVDSFQNDQSVFVFLLSTRAGGLGINLTAADTVIFYDSDWNPTIDAQAMDRAHRLGQTKPVTVFRLITKKTVEERIMARARQKATIQNLVIEGGNFEMSDEQIWSSNEVLDILIEDEANGLPNARKRKSTFTGFVPRKKTHPRKLNNNI